MCFPIGHGFGPEVGASTLREPPLSLGLVKSGLASNNLLSGMDARGIIAVKEAIHKMAHAFTDCDLPKLR